VGDLEGVRVAVFGGRAHIKAMSPLGAVKLEKVLRRMLHGPGADPI
jgi:hypothetical protein